MLTRFFGTVVLQGRVYETPAASMPNLKKRIGQCIDAISVNLLQHLMTSVPSGVQQLSDGNGGHFKMLFQEGDGYSYVFIELSINSIFCRLVFNLKIIAYYCPSSYIIEQIPVAELSRRVSALSCLLG